MTEEKKRKIKPKAIVLDNDDCIVDFDGGVCKVHNKKYGTSLTPRDLVAWNYVGLELKDASGNVVKGEELLATYKEYEDHGLYVGLNLLRDVHNALECMKEKGYKIFILTARPPKYGRQTELNLIRHNIEKFIDDVFFQPEDFPAVENFKVKKIKELSKDYNIQVFADDRGDTVQAVADNCNVNKVFLVENSKNKNFEYDHEEIIKVRDIMEIVRYLKKVN